MNNETESSIQHLNLVSEFSRQLAAHEIAIYHHRYDYLAFGSWVIVAGTRKRHVRLTWDGKESRLDAASCVLADSQSTADWTDFDSRSFSRASQDAVLQAGSEMVLGRFAV